MWVTDEQVFEMPVVLYPDLQNAFGKVHSARVLFQAKKQLY